MGKQKQEKPEDDGIMYAVRPFHGSVFSIVRKDSDKVVFRGTLPECESWLRLVDVGYIVL